MAILVPIDCDDYRASLVSDPGPTPMDLDGDHCALVPAPMDRDRDGDGDRAALVPSTGGGGGRVRFCDLPDDILACILARLSDTRAAAQSSVLSHRWRYVWTRVCGLFLHHDQPHDSSPVRDALAGHAAHAATNIHLLNVHSPYSATPDATASWLRVAAPLVTGELSFRNRSSVPLEMLDFEMLDETEERVAFEFELPCFTRVTKITLSLGFLGLSLPPSGVFAALRELHLEYVQFHGECTLEDAMLPVLEWLEFRMSRGLASLTLRLKPLILMSLFNVWGMRRLNAVVPGLKQLHVVDCFHEHLEAVSVVAEELEELRWLDRYSPELVNFNEMPRLRIICPQRVISYGWLQREFHPSCQRLLNLYPSIDCLGLFVVIEPEQGDDGVTPFMEGITGLPYIRVLFLELRTEGHVYGASVLHILTMCTGIAELTLINQEDFQGEESCSLDCICRQPPSWEAQNVRLKLLEEVEITNFRGQKHEIDFLKLLFNAATVLRNMRITCHHSLAGSKELSEDLQNFARQETTVQVIFRR